MLETLLKQKFKTSNKREEDLVACIEISIISWIDSYKNGSMFYCKSATEQINGMLACLYFLNMIKEPVYIFDTDLINLI